MEGQQQVSSEVKIILLFLPEWSFSLSVYFPSLSSSFNQGIRFTPPIHLLTQWYNSPTKAEHQLPRLDNQRDEATARAWSHSQELGCCQREGQGTVTRPSPSQAGGVADSLQRRLWELGRLPARLLPVSPPRVGWWTPCPDRQEKKTLPCHEATGRLEWERSSASSTICSYKQGTPRPLRSVPQRQGHHPNASSSSAPTGAAQDGAWGTCFQHWSHREGSRHRHVLPCCHLSLRPWHLQSTENNSFLSTHVELFFKGMSPPNGNNFLLHFQPSVLNIKRELIEHI